MPYAFETKRLRLPETKDRRCKLTEAQRAEIALNEMGLSQRKLAQLYKVSRRLIQFILDPAKHEANLLRREERGGWKALYDKDEHKSAMKKTRRYKQSIKGDLCTPQSKNT